MATRSETTRGFSLACPKCGQAEDEVFVYLHDLDTFTCASCDETFTPQEARDFFVEQARRYEALVAWIESAPVL